MGEGKIYFDNPDSKFYAGQTLNGRIEYVFDSPRKVRCIYVIFVGVGHTEWTVHKKNRRNQTISINHTGDEDYLNNTYYLLGDNSGGTIELPAGMHVFNFTCALPPNLPSSFQGRYGYIRYTISIVLKRPWRFDQETKMPFTVINAFDLNQNPSYKKPIHIQMEKTFCCHCCESAPLSVDVRAPVSGFCPGQVIPITVEVENNSRVKVLRVKIIIRQLVTYKATVPKRATFDSVEDVVFVQNGPVSAGSNTLWNLSLEVPAIPPSELVNCKIINLDYDLKVECKTCILTGMNDTQYIAIGTVPYVGIVWQAQSSAPSTSEGPSSPD